MIYVRLNEPAKPATSRERAPAARGKLRLRAGAAVPVLVIVTAAS